MFKKVKNLFKKKPSSPVEKKSKGEPQPKTEEAGAALGETAPSSVSETPREQRPVSATSEMEASEEQKKPEEPKEPKEPEKPKASELKPEESEKPKAPSLKPEESREPKTVAPQDPSPAVGPSEKPAVASHKEEKERVETAEEKPAVTSSKKEKEVETTTKEKQVKTDGASQPKETPAVTSAPVSSPEISSETPPPHSEPEEVEVSKVTPKPKEPQRETVKLKGLFAFKMSMTSLYDEQGHRVPVTALKYQPWVVSQIKTKDKEGYSAVQLACGPQKNNRSTRPLIKHLAPAGFKEGARYIREIRQDLPENIKVGQELSIESLKKGDRVRVSSRSKGRGYAGVVKRWGFRGGPASHGSKTHRKTGSIGQCTQPSRVMPGRKMPGQYGFETITLNSVPVVDVFPDEGVIFVKGPVSGSRNTLVSLKKVEEARA